MNSKKKCAVIGIVLGLVMIVFGIITAANPPETFHTETASNARFGADFYTDEYEATMKAANNVSAVGSDLRELGVLTAKAAGFAFIFSGLFTILIFSIKYIEFDEKEKVVLSAAPSYASQSVSVGNSAEKFTSNMAEEEIGKLVLLLDSGAITEEEFNKQRSKILSKVNS